MMTNEFLSSVEASLEQSSLYTTSGEQYGVVNDFTPSDCVFAESGYNAGSQYFSSTSYGDEFVEPSATDYYDTSFVLDGYESESTVSYQPVGSYIPILYPVSNSYMLYDVAIPIDYNGAVFYNYEQFAVPIFNSSYLLTDEITSGSELTVDNSIQQFADDLEYYDEAGSSYLLTDEINTGPELTVDNSPQQFMEDLEQYDESGSLQLIPENDFVTTERKEEIKRKKDWLYLLSLSGKLSIKDHIPEVDVMAVIFEGDENTEISNDMSDSDGVDEESETDVSPEIDKSDGDTDQKYPNNTVLETSDVMSTSNEPLEETFPDSGDTWNDFFFCSIDDEEFGIESCFNNSTFENEFVRKSCNKDGYKKKSNLSSTSGKTFMILGRLNQQIEILPTIQEEEEPVIKSEELHVSIEKPPLQIIKEDIVVIEEECISSKEQNAEEMENSSELAEATEEVGSSQKPKKKKFKTIRRFFSNITSCFSKMKESPG